MSTPTPRTDTEITFTGTYTCTHHNDAERTACPVCLVTALTAEREQLRAENATLRAAQKACEACDEPTAFEVRQLRARAERAEADEIVALTHWNKELERAMKAEAQLHALTLICGTNDANKFETWIDRANARAEKAEAAETVALAHWNKELERAMKAEADLAALEQCHDDNCRAVVKLDAELAIERARLNWLETPSGMDWQWEPERLTVSRASIDAAMKEDSK